MNQVDVLLINLPTASWYKEKFASSNAMPPLGLLYIATVLKQNNYKVKVLDFAVEYLSKEAIVNILRESNPRLVGLSTYNESWTAQKLISKLIKEVLPQTKIFAGGAFATFCYQDILNQSHTDYVIRGEGEFPTLHLCNILFGRDNEDLKNIKAIAYKTDSGEIITNDNFERINNLDELPIPDRDFVNLEKYVIPCTVSTARGCPGDCIFCSSKAFWGRRVYMRSAQSVFDEFMYLHEKYSNEIFYVTDDTFTTSAKRAREFCDLVNKSNIKFHWGCESRADVLTDDLVKMLSQAGCTKLQIGMESADNEILKKLKKRVTVEQIEAGIKLAAKYQMHISVSYIVGHAFDTHESIRKTLDFASYVQKEYGAFIMGSVNTPFPGTEQYELADELGIKIHTDNWDNFRLNNAIISTKNVTRQDLQYYHNIMTELANQNVVTG